MICLFLIIKGYFLFSIQEIHNCIVFVYYSNAQHQNSFVWICIYAHMNLEGRMWSDGIKWGGEGGELWSQCMCVGLALRGGGPSLPTPILIIITTIIVIPYDHPHYPLHHTCRSEGGGRWWRNSSSSQRMINNSSNSNSNEVGTCSQQSARQAVVAE